MPENTEEVIVPTEDLDVDSIGQEVVSNEVTDEELAPETEVEENS